MIAIEGNYLGRVVNTGVGSVRWRVRYTGPGGHAWERADAPSAVHAAAGGKSRGPGWPGPINRAATRTGKKGPQNAP